VGSGGGLRGISVGGAGVGAGEDDVGITLGGIGVGAGENLTGFAFGGVGVGAGQSVRGIAIGGIGVGAGEELKGLSAAVVGIGAPMIKGIAVAGAVGAKNTKALIIAPAYFQAGEKTVSDGDEDNGEMNGVSISAFNHVKGTQKGISIGVFNYAAKQRGFQLGLLNYVKDNPRGLRLLPVFNLHFKNKNTK
ncbi:MAG TPA: hypothetical protein P5280_08985, partial [Cyclobacteriaceae bacterium]|nr:hypothetical protein [Cyclobacteriaceae bacterium]